MEQVNTTNMSYSEKIIPCCYSQKVIPLAFDESLSYYEQICRINKKVNELISIFNEQLTEELEKYIDERFNDIMLDTMYDPETETLTLYLKHTGGSE